MRREGRSELLALGLLLLAEQQQEQEQTQVPSTSLGYRLTALG
jgi:hypothetical protein